MHGPRGYIHNRQTLYQFCYSTGLATKESNISMLGLGDYIWTLCGAAKAGGCVKVLNMSADLRYVC